MARRWDAVSKKDRTWLVISLIVALIHGLVYIVLVPPWQHYDEPNHFEYAWLAAHLDHWPVEGDFDPEMSRAVVQSMVEYGFFKGMDYQPDFESDQPIHIFGYAQFSEPRLYYALASLPLRWLQFDRVDLQLYSVRLVSLLLFLITILAAWGIAVELTSAGHPLRWMLPVSLALLPGLADLMTAVNNDAAAVVTVSLFLWAGVRLVKRGPSLLDLLWLTGVLGLAYYAKNTTMMVIPGYLLILLFTFLRGRLRIAAWGLAVAALVGALFVSIRLDDALAWYRATSQGIPVRAQHEQAVSGNYILQLDLEAKVVPTWSPALYQPVPIEVAQGLAGKTVTLGVWMWASQPLTVNKPVSIRTSERLFNEKVDLGVEPEFYALQATIPAESFRIWVYLSPASPTVKKAWLYYDGLVLAEGEYALDMPPQFEDVNGERGVWGGQPFINLLRNASAEKPGPRLRPEIDNFATSILPDNTRPSYLLVSLLDMPGSSVHYKASAEQLFRTFWAKFGWGHIELIGTPVPYDILLVITCIALVACLYGLVRRRHSLSWEVVFCLMAVGLLTWAITLMRGISYIALPGFYIPVARHAYPVVILTMLVLCIGWLEMAYLIKHIWIRVFKARASSDALQPARREVLDQYLAAGFLVSFLLLDILSWLTIARYYS
ncbi:MAG: glycosyltransferase family 39 protein [Anaerolineales bacterium]|nr:glycosyltransferase family 39 protein [Anaerolineales bacterium]